MGKILLDDLRAHRGAIAFGVLCAAIFAAVFALPAFYGRNLDALYDVLTELPPCTLLLEHTGCLYDALGPYAEKLLGVFRDAARENPNIQIQEDIKTF